MTRAARTAFLLLIAPGCATTVESRVTDPAEIAEARAANQGTEPAAANASIVIMRLKIDADGIVRDAQVVESGGPRADEAALKAVRVLHFNPAHQDGRPVESTIRFAFAFSP